MANGFFHCRPLGTKESPPLLLSGVGLWKLLRSTRPGLANAHQLDEYEVFLLLVTHLWTSEEKGSIEDDTVQDE